MNEMILCNEISYYLTIKCSQLWLCIVFILKIVNYIGNGSVSLTTYKVVNIVDVVFCRIKVNDIPKFIIFHLEEGVLALIL